jgi:molecular chaperone GrpE
VADNDQNRDNPAKNTEERQATAAEAARSAAADTQASAEAELNQETGDGQIAALRAELEQVREHSLRCQAELENYRKRVARQMEEERRYACIGLMRDLLPVWDNTVRAIEAAEKTKDIDSLVAGFKMVADQLVQALARHHCTRIPALHEPFNPHVHQAISHLPSDQPADTVAVVVQDGFQLHDRVVRPSQVVVSSGPPPDAGGGVR